MIKVMKSGEIGRLFALSRRRSDSGVSVAVSKIIADVRENGDEALFRYARQFDGAELESLEVSPEEFEAALAAVEPRLLDVMERAAANIEAFHRRQVRSGYVMTGPHGVVMGIRVLPLARVGVYAPGGTASYPSTVLMNCIPARLAGVGEIVLATPPAPDGAVRPEILAAAKIGGVSRVIKAGGAQAIAAMAYGTQSVPRVDKIVGPGNAYVAEAKKQVFGDVGIDMIAGPSEILIIADGSSVPEHLAADMLSQAEHDASASAVLLTDSLALAEKVQLEIERQLESLPRRDIARAAIEKNGAIVVAESLRHAVEIANELAPEHLELCVESPFDYLDAVRNAGSVFLGRYCPEALGDYFAGPNHTLPTSGTARFSSPLSVDEFVKKSSFTYYTPEALSEVGRDVAYFAETEGLTAHAKSVLARLGGEGER